MKRYAPVLLAAGFAMTLAGCTPTDVADTADTTNTSQAAASGLTLVSLKVPNMV